MFYKFARIVCRFVLILVRRWEVRGRENIPARGGVVIVSNHTSYWDPVIIGCILNRKVSFMGKEELFKINPVFTWIIKALGAFPVKRGQMDRKAINLALHHLQTGNIIGLFPEGGISRTGNLRDARNGAAMLAVKSGVPVLPVGITGAKGWGKVIVRVGESIDTSRFTNEKINKGLLDEFSNTFMKKIEDLL